jgi:hypothetical protein
MVASGLAKRHDWNAGNSMFALNQHSLEHAAAEAARMFELRRAQVVRVVDTCHWQTAGLSSSENNALTRPIVP